MFGRWLVVAAMLTSGSALEAERCTVPVLVRDGGRLTVELIELDEGQMRVFPPGGEPAFVAPLLPVGPGMSGDLVTAARPGLVVVRCAEGAVRVSVRPPEGGDARDLPAIPVANYARYRLRVNLTEAGDRRSAFRLRGSLVERDDGPVLDMFQGRVPLAPGDVAITLEVREAPRPPSLTGSIAVAPLGPWLATPVGVPGGGHARFVVDLGAARTVVWDGLIPSGTPRHQLVAVEQSAQGTRTLAGSAGGAGGEAAGVTRVVDLPWLDLGGLRVDSVSVLVMDRPMIAGADTLWGILGLDVLRRAGRVRGTFGGAEGVLTLGGPARRDAVELPIREVRGLLLVEGAAGDAPLYWLLDSGARVAVVPDELARRRGWTDPAAPADSLRGIDEHAIAARPARPPAPRLGDWVGPVIPFVAADFPVTRALGLTQDTGILGQPFFRAVGEIEIDFAAGVLRVPPRR